MHFDLAQVHGLQVVEELGLDVGRHGATQILDVRVVELEVLDVLEALGEAAEDRELALERILAEEQVEHRLVVLLVAPVRVAHRDLVQVGEQRLHRVVQLAARCYACRAERRR